jgi:hypothetical protein
MKFFAAIHDHEKNINFHELVDFLDKTVRLIFLCFFLSQFNSLWTESPFVTKIRMQKILIGNFTTPLKTHNIIFEILPLLGELYHLLKFSEGTKLVLS